MPELFRLVKARHADQAFDGEGARLSGGRWNSRGVALIYTADSIALAALELLVHLHSHEVLNSYRLYRIDIPDEDLLALDDRDLPRDWRNDPPPSSTAQVGDGWVAAGASLALAVPSAIVPSQHNVLVNPAHAGFAQAIESVREEPFLFDRRLLKNNPGKA
ncbi:MAG: RES domain-containing protein [Gammaproteobacteria bacterium]|nr:RES domain-containing protein [Gammaproteobacteria bacterium]